MTVSATSLGGLVRVTVISGEKRTDLALPSVITVAELLPEVARAVGALEPTTAHTGFRLLTSDGTELSPATGLAFQSVEDGAVLTLAPGATSTPRVYDDVVEAMADVVEEGTTPWKPESARRTALVASGGLLAVGALAIGLERVSVIGGALAGAVALVLAAAAVVLSRLEDEHEVALLLGWGAVTYAAVGAFTAVSGDQILAAPVASAGGAGAAAALLVIAGIGRHRLLLLPAVVLGVVAAAASGLVLATDLDAPDVYLVAMVVVVIAAGAQPAIALASAGASSPQPEDPTSLPEDPDEIHLEEVRAGARIGHDVLLAGTVTSGLLITLVAPLAVTLGLSGTLAAIAASGALLLRTRLFRSGTEVAGGLLSGSAGLLSTAVSVLVLQPDWRPGLIVVLVLVAAAVLVATLVPASSSVTRGRAAEIAEVVALVALLPLTVIAIGLLTAIRS